MKTLAIVGGGIAGLAAARTAVDCAREAGVELQVTVFEREAAVGGKAQSVASDGWLVESGPGAYLDNEPALAELVEKAGLAKQRLIADASAANRFILWGGKMRDVSPNPVRLARSGLLGVRGFARLLCEPFIPARRNGGDERVWDFARRRLGRAAAERLISPMVLGVFAGDARELSLEAAFPKIVALEREHGSLVRGMIRRRREGKGGGPGGPAGDLTSFSAGLQTLPTTLADSGDFEVRCGAPVDGLQRQNGGWRLSADGVAESADAVILAGEAWSVGPLLQGFGDGLSERLASIDYPAVTVVALGFGEEGLAKIPRGFGVLIPRPERVRILGCLWDSHFFPGRSPGSHILVRAMLGGAVDPEAGALDEGGAAALVRREVAKLFGLEEAPVFERVVRWPRAIPQYRLGHLELVTEIERETRMLPGLFLAGNYLRGIAFGKAAASGVLAGERVVEWLVGPHAARDGDGSRAW